MRGGRFASRGSGGQCWYNHMRKVSNKNGSGDGGGRTPRGSSTPPHSFGLSLNLPDCLGALERFVFQSKKVAKWLKKTSRLFPARPTTEEKRPSPPKNWSPPPASTRCCFVRKCCPGSLLYILIKIRFFSRTVHSHRPHFPLQKKLLCAGKVWFCCRICCP
jgi:hypothetical protein